jgi:replicative DNA helicase
MSIAAENVIGGLLLDQSAFWRVSELVTPDDFPPNLRPLFVRIAEEARAGRPFDFITAAEEGFTDAVTLASHTAGTALIADYAKRLKSATEARRVQDAGRRIATCESYEDAQRVLAEVRPQEAQRVKTVKDGLAEMIDTLQARASGVQGLSWGIPEVDSVLGRLVGSRLYGIAARAKMGKTTFVLQPQLATLMVGGRVLNNSLEMTAGELTQRALACLGQFSHDTFERDDGVPDEMWPVIKAAARKLHDRQWLIDDQPGLPLEKLLSRARRP